MPATYDRPPSPLLCTCLPNCGRPSFPRRTLPLTLSSGPVTFHRAHHVQNRPAKPSFRLVLRCLGFSPRRILQQSSVHGARREVYISNNGPANEHVFCRALPIYISPDVQTQTQSLSIESLQQLGKEREKHKRQLGPTYQMRPSQFIHRLCIVQLDIQILIDAL